MYCNCGPYHQGNGLNIRMHRDTAFLSSLVDFRDTVVLITGALPWCSLLVCRCEGRGLTISDFKAVLCSNFLSSMWLLRSFVFALLSVVAEV